MKGNSTSAKKSSDQSSVQTNQSYVEMNEPVTQQKLADVWNIYDNKIKADNMRLYSILTNYTPQLQQNNSIFLELTSSMQEDELLKEKPAIMSFVKKELQNTQLELRTSILKEDDKMPVKVFTAADKLEVMIQKNPALALLKQQFNLDLD